MFLNLIFRKSNHWPMKKLSRKRNQVDTDLVVIRGDIETGEVAGMIQWDFHLDMIGSQSTVTRIIVHPDMEIGGVESLPVD